METQNNPVENLVHFVTQVAPGIQSVGYRHRSVIAVLRFNFPNLSQSEELIDNQEFLSAFGITVRRDHDKMLILEIPYEIGTCEYSSRFLLTEMHNWQYVDTVEKTT
jgi:hypothetical protein